MLYKKKIDGRWLSYRVRRKESVFTIQRDEMKTIKLPHKFGNDTCTVDAEAGDLMFVGSDRSYSIIKSKDLERI
jgi:hypothetical protein